MNVQEQIEKYITSQPEPKRSDMRELHRLTLQVSPECKLWFSDGKDNKNHTVFNPTIGYGFYTIKYANGKSRESFQIGVSGNKTGISVYILGLKDKKYLTKTYGKKLGKASVTGYCIRFKSLKDINIDTLEAAIRYGLAAQNEKRQADEIIPLLKASSYRCKGAPVCDPYSPDPRHKIGNRRTAFSNVRATIWLKHLGQH